MMDECVGDFSPTILFCFVFFCLHSVSLFLFFLWRRVRETTTATATTILQIRAAVVERRRELDKLEIRFDCITFYTGINRSLNNLNAGEWFFMQIEWLIDGPLALEFQSSFLLGFISIFFWWSFFFQRCQFVNHFFVYIVWFLSFWGYGYCCSYLLLWLWLWLLFLLLWLWNAGVERKKKSKKFVDGGVPVRSFRTRRDVDRFPVAVFLLFPHVSVLFLIWHDHQRSFFLFVSFFFFVPFSVAYISTKNHHRNNKKEEKETEREEKGRNVRRNRNESKKIIRVSFIHYPSTHRWFQCHGSLFVFSLLQQQQKKQSMNSFLQFLRVEIKRQHDSRSKFD